LMSKYVRSAVIDGLAAAEMPVRRNNTNRVDKSILYLTMLLLWFPLPKTHLHCPLGDRPNLSYIIPNYFALCAGKKCNFRVVI